LTVLPKVVYQLFADESAAANHYDLHMFMFAESIGQSSERRDAGELWQ
jgi:hypothetical protein